MIRPHLKRLGSILTARGMSLERVSRVLGELDDHAQDLREELETKGRPPAQAEVLALERIGDAETLADEIFRGYAQRTFWGRHPVFSCFALPMLSVALVLTAAITGINLFFGPPVKVLRAFGMGIDFPFIKAISMGWFTLNQFTLTGLVAWVLLRAAKKRVLEMKWAFLAAGMTALLGFFLFPALKILPSNTAGKIVSGSFSVGLGLNTAVWPSADHWVRFFLPFILFAVVYAGNLKAGYRKPAE